MKLPMATFVCACILVAAACTADPSTDATELTGPTEVAEQPPQPEPEPSATGFSIVGDAQSTVPDGAELVFTLEVDLDADRRDALDALLAQEQNDDQVVVSIEISGCILLSIWALPRPEDVLVGFEFDESTRCVRAFDYTAVFLIDETGTNSEGPWDYSDAAPKISVQRAD